MDKMLEALRDTLAEDEGRTWTDPSVVDGKVLVTYEPDGTFVALSMETF